MNRVSQGSGAMLLSADELAEMARIGADSGIEVSLFIGPREEWDVGAWPNPARPVPGRAHPGVRQLQARRSTTCCARLDHGIRGFLVADTGLLELLADMQAGRADPGVGGVEGSRPCLAHGQPADGHPAGAAGRLDHQRARRRHPGPARGDAVGHHPARSTCTWRRPARMGGVVRGQEAADLVTVASPLYVKFGLRNSRLLYPSGLHLADEAAAIAREKVHRARVALEWMDRSGLELRRSPAPGTRPGCPLNP